MHGTVWARPRPGGGAEFGFSLPLMRVPPGCGRSDTGGRGRNGSVDRGNPGNPGTRRVPRHSRASISSARAGLRWAGRRWSRRYRGRGGRGRGCGGGGRRGRYGWRRCSRCCGVGLVTSDCEAEALAPGEPDGLGEVDGVAGCTGLGTSGPAGTSWNGTPAAGGLPLSEAVTAPKIKMPTTTAIAGGAGRCHGNAAERRRQLQGHLLAQHLAQRCARRIAQREFGGGAVDEESPGQQGGQDDADRGETGPGQNKGAQDGRRDDIRASTQTSRSSRIATAPANLGVRRKTPCSWVSPRYRPARSPTTATD